MEEEKEAAVVTEDRWMREEGGQLDETDRAILQEASENGKMRVRVINIKEMLESIKGSEPKKYQGIKKNMEGHAGKRLTFDELVELSRSADERIKEFEALVAPMTLGQAAQVRLWRVHRRMTWRSLARAAYLDEWFNRNWEPQSNQLMGMALAEKAAAIFGENFRKDPWN